MSFVVIEGDVFQLDNEANPIAPDAGAAAVALPATQGGVLVAAKRVSDGKPVLLKAENDGTIHVAQGLKGAGSNAWPTALYDASGNPVAVVLDNSIYRLEARSALVGQTAGAGGEKKVTVIDDVTTATHKRLQVEADIKPGATITTTPGTGSPEDLFVEELKNGGSPDMNVDGSGTPVVFAALAHATKDIRLRELRLIISGPKTMKMDGATFGEAAGLLTNGILIEAVVNNGITTQLGNIRRNEGFAKLASSTGLNLLYSDNGVATLIVSSIVFGGRTLLKAGTGDRLRVTIRDDITSGGSRKVKFFQAVAFGAFE